LVVPVRFAAEQRWLIACGETAGHGDLGTKKLRSSDVDFSNGRIDVAAPQLHDLARRILRARVLGYVPQLLRRQSHHRHDLPPINGCTLGTPDALDSVNALQSNQRKRFRIKSIQMMRRKRFGKFIDHCRGIGQAAYDDVAGQVRRIDDIAELRV